MDDIPILYLYMFRNIKRISSNEVIEYCKFVEALRKVIHKAPFPVYTKIAQEMLNYGLFEYVNKHFIRVKTNKDIDKKLRELKEFCFPLTP